MIHMLPVGGMRRRKYRHLLSFMMRVGPRRASHDDWPRNGVRFTVVEDHPIEFLNGTEMRDKKNQLLDHFL